MSSEIILVWLGPTWVDVVPLIRVLCVASLSLFAACLTFPVLVAAGRVRDASISSLISLPPSVALLFFASFWGVQAVANAALLAFPLQAIVAIWFIARRLAIGPAEFIKSTSRSGIATTCCAVGLLLSKTIAQSSGLGPMMALALAGAVAFTCWWIGLIVTDHPLLARIRGLAQGFVPAPTSTFGRLANAVLTASRLNAHKE
jgi:O-antigen/teichoic acid export membrane protein